MKKHPEAQESSFRNYVSRHSRLLIFVGALIVFVTFLVKESLRERLKDLVDSIDTAQSVFVAEQENQQMSQGLAEIYRISVVSYDNMHNPARQPGEAYPHGTLRIIPVNVIVSVRGTKSVHLGLASPVAVL